MTATIVHLGTRPMPDLPARSVPINVLCRPTRFGLGLGRSGRIGTVSRMRVPTRMAS